MNSSNTFILTFGDKLKAIRVKYNLRQDEISGQDITRNLISEIETNKANITKKTAEIIIKNLNAIARKKHFKVTETIEYLLESELEQANKVIDKYISELRALVVCKDDSFVKELKETEEFLINWDIRDKKIVIYELAGDYFYNQNDFYKSVNYYERALELINKAEVTETLLALLRKLSMVYTYVDNYKESVKCCEFALEHFKDMTNEYSVVFLYNSGLGYKKLGDWDKALEKLNQAENLVDRNDLNKMFKIKNVKANCLYRMSLFQDSLYNFNELLVIYKNDLEKQVHIRINMISNYIKLNDTKEINKNLEILTKDLPKINANNSYISEFYHETGKIYKYLSEEKLEEEYYIKALELCEKQKNCSLFYKIVYDLIELYTKLNNTSKMLEVKNKILAMANKYEQINEKVIIFLIAFYSKNNDNNVVNELASFLLKLI
ncbi:transcriptional regulator [Clostridium hydrogenum]|uniref:transcriptional regulator n=1 Tax=Clostridium hydrogenum TaxID=2855764 RepID=UPI001F20609B|nr:transcriptional regulator [Clostridium hydrogenum]